MNTAVVGGGTRCRLLLELVEKHAFQEMDLKVVAVADKRDDAPGMSKARRDGLFVTRDYNDFFDRDDIDLIIELTGDQETFYDILFKKKKTVRAINHRTAQLFWEVSHVSSIKESTRQELEKTRTLYEVAINHLIQEDVMIIDANYRILDINEPMLKKLGLKREEVIGRYCYEIKHYQSGPCSGENRSCPHVQTFESQKPSRATHIHLDKDDKEIYYSISCYPLFQDNKVIAVAEISRDITKDMNIQIENVNLLRGMMQQQKLATIGRLAATLAHEINNPLTTILTTAMLIQEDIDPDDPLCQELGTIASETLRCRKIVTSLLDFARQTKPTKKENYINDIVCDTIVLTQKQAAFKDVGIEPDFSKDNPMIYVDKSQIEQSLINLVLNAIESTDPGGKISVATTFIPADEMVEIAISDTGGGIAEDKIDQIFEPFFTTKESGTGLGLSITHGIIEQHGGKIDVKSKPGHGATFTIRLPISKADNHAH